MTTANGISRPLAWLLALVVVAVAALYLLVPEPVPAVVALDVAVPSHPSAITLDHRGRVIHPPAHEAGDRKPIAASERATIDEEPDHLGDSMSAVGTIEGRVVREEDERPIAGAEVCLEKGFSGRGLPLVHTDNNGAFRVANVRTGTWNLRAKARGRAEREVSVDVTQETSGFPIVLKLPAQRAVNVRVLDASGQVATPASLGLEEWNSGLICLAVGNTCAPPGSTFRHDAAIAYRARAAIPRARSLQWHVEIPGDGAACVHLLMGDHVLKSQAMSAGGKPIDFYVGARDIARSTAYCDVLLLADETGQPIASGLVEVVPTRGPKRESRSGPDGRTALGPFPAAEVVVRGSSPGHGSASAVVQLPLRASLVLRLPSARRIAGTVLDERGETVDRARVSLYKESQSRVGQPAGDVRFERAPNGRFSFDGLEPDVYLLLVDVPPARSAKSTAYAKPTASRPTPAQQPRRVDVQWGDVLDVVLHLPAGSR